MLLKKKQLVGKAPIYFENEFFPKILLNKKQKTLTQNVCNC